MQHEPSQFSEFRSPCGLRSAPLAALVLGIAAPLTGCSSGGGSPSGPDLTGNARGADRATLNANITLPGEVPAGRALQGGIASPGIGATWTGSNVFDGTTRRSTSSIFFTIDDLNAADYLLFLRVDADGSGDFGSGDYGGYYSDNGSVVDPNNATVVSITAGAIQRVDFAVGTIP